MVRDSRQFEEAYKAFKSKRYAAKSKFKPKKSWADTKAKKKLRRKIIGSKPYFLYVLELEDGCYYIGCTRWPRQRLATHMKGEGSMWTMKHKPVKRIELINTFITRQRDVHLLEDKLTLKYAKRYGVEVVRGGGYCQSKPRWPGYLLKDRQEEVLELELQLASEMKQWL